MVTFVVKGIVLVSLIVYSGFLLLPPSPPTDVTTGYMAAMIDKHRRLDSLSSPRLIIAGGSNAAFGINSERLQHSLGLNTVNLGLAAGVGLPFIIHEVESVMKPGDIILLSTEYYMGDNADCGTMEILNELYPPSRDYAPECSAMERMLSALDQRVQRLQARVRSTFTGEKIFTGIDPTHAWVPEPEEVYMRGIFSPYGDVVLRPGQRAKSFSHIHIEPSDYDKYIDIMNEMHRIARSKNVTVVYTYPPYMNSDFINSKNGVRTFRQQLESKLTIPVLGTPEDFVFPDSLYFNTAYHLTREGRELRTSRLIALLLNYLAQGTQKNIIALNASNSRPL